MAKKIEIQESVRKLIEEVKESTKEELSMKMDLKIMEMQIRHSEKENGYLRQIENAYDSLKTATETNQMLLDVVPKVLGPEGATLCRVAEQVIPGDETILIRFSPTTKKVYLSIIPDANGNYMKIQVFSDLIRKALELARNMTDEDGTLSKNGSIDNKIEN